MACSARPATTENKTSANAKADTHPLATEQLHLTLQTLSGQMTTLGLALLQRRGRRRPPGLPLAPITIWL